MKNTDRILIMTLICVLFPSFRAFGVERRVPSEYPNIQAAVDACYSGDTVIVADGVYSGGANVDFYIPDNVELKSENGPTSTIFDCSGVTIPFNYKLMIVGSGSTIDGFTIKNAFSTECYSCVVYLNGKDDEASIKNCILNNNAAHNGPVGCSGNTRIDNCIIHDNAALCVYNPNAKRWEPGTGGGIVCENSESTIANCLIYDNISSLGGGIWSYNSRPAILNCTILNNRAEHGGGLYVANDSYPWVANTIIRGNVGYYEGSQIYLGEGVPAYPGDNPIPSKLTIENSNVESGQEDIYKSSTSMLYYYPSNIDVDPKFINSSNHEYGLSEHSNCIDGGTNTVLSPAKITSDLEGNPRVVYGMSSQSVDMGAYEYQGPTSQSDITTITNVNMSSKKGLVGFSISGTFAPQSFSGQDVYVKIGSYEETIPCGINGLVSNKKGDAYSYKASAGKVTLIKINLKTNTFTIAGKGITESFGSPLEVAVAFEE